MADFRCSGSEAMRVFLVRTFPFSLLQFGGKNLTLCWPASLHGSCCTDLSHAHNGPEGEYGIVNGTVKDDLITHKILPNYYFNGSSTDCSKGMSI